MLSYVHPGALNTSQNPAPFPNPRSRQSLHTQNYPRIDPKVDSTPKMKRNSANIDVSFPANSAQFLKRESHGWSDISWKQSSIDARIDGVERAMAWSIHAMMDALPDDIPAIAPAAQSDHGPAQVVPSPPRQNPFRYGLNLDVDAIAARDLQLCAQAAPKHPSTTNTAVYASSQTQRASYPRGGPNTTSPPSTQSIARALEEELRLAGSSMPELHRQPPSQPGAVGELPGSVSSRVGYTHQSKVKYSSNPIPGSKNFISELHAAAMSEKPKRNSKNNDPQQTKAHIDASAVHANQLAYSQQLHEVALQQYYLKQYQLYQIEQRHREIQQRQLEQQQRQLEEQREIQLRQQQRREQLQREQQLRAAALAHASLMGNTPDPYYSLYMAALRSNQNPLMQQAATNIPPANPQYQPFRAAQSNAGRELIGTQQRFVAPEDYIPPSPTGSYSSGSLVNGRCSSLSPALSDCWSDVSSIPGGSVYGDVPYTTSQHTSPNAYNSARSSGYLEALTAAAHYAQAQANKKENDRLLPLSAFRPNAITNHRALRYRRQLEAMPVPETLICYACNRPKPSGEFSRSQIRKAQFAVLSSALMSTRQDPNQQSQQHLGGMPGVNAGMLCLPLLPDGRIDTSLMSPAQVTLAAITNSRHKPICKMCTPPQTTHLQCTVCEQRLPLAQFSKAQRRMAELARCVWCVGVASKGGRATQEEEVDGNEEEEEEEDGDVTVKGVIRVPQFSDDDDDCDDSSESKSESCGHGRAEIAVEA
ncbi:hypothetical protein BJ742DRAFT_776685 [Cladochytrium replicatum]|nr:hypothetical protein BJ742DRAFT_776685 [Cladochytrium replicatum]